jgi:hypothetical protein
VGVSALISTYQYDILDSPVGSTMIQQLETAQVCQPILRPRING